MTWITNHNTTAGSTASFGFRAVPETERQGLVNQVFASVAGRYDLMNDLMSGGLHRLWKRELIAMLNPPRGRNAVQAARRRRRHRRYRAPLRPRQRPVGDGRHLRHQSRNARRRPPAHRGRRTADRIACVEGNAEALPFESGSFDAYTIAFGIRNVTHIDKALAEAYRVLKPGGRFLCLEFSECQVPILDRLYDFHSFEIIPRLGQMTAGAAEPYRYLVESIRRFPNQEPFAGLIRDAGFSRVSYRNLTGGIAAIHAGWKI